MTIANDALVVNLQIGFWAGYKLDKERSKEVTEGAGAAADAARVNKHLIARDTLNPVTKAADAVRRHFYAKTLPWKDNGDRLIPREGFEAFIEKHGALADRFATEVATFIDSTYVSAPESARFRMGTMFKAEDYPVPDALRAKFYCRLDLDPVSEAGDFRVTMSDAAASVLMEATERQLNARIAKATGEVWRRLADTLGHFADRMRGDAIFRENTLTNLIEMAETLPGLNITNDARISALCSEIKQRFNNLDAKDLRTKPIIRAAVSSEAQEILDRLHGFNNLGESS